MLAYSGAAATLINGCTLHSYFKINIKSNGIELKAESKSWRDIKLVEVFIIDEYSMLELDIFTRLNTFLMALHENDNNFGNKSLLLVGDPGQLAAITMSVYNHPIYKNDMEVILLRKY